MDAGAQTSSSERSPGWAQQASGETARAIANYPGGHNEGFPDTFKQFSAKVYNYIRKGDFTAQPDFPTFKDGHYELVLSEAIELSAKEGKWVSL